MKKITRIGAFPEFLILEERKPAKRRTGLYKTFVLSSLEAIAQTRSLVPTIKKIEDMDSYGEASKESKKELQGISKKLSSLNVGEKLRNALNVDSSVESHKEMFNSFVSIENSLIDILKNFKEVAGSYSSKVEDGFVGTELSQNLSKEIMDLSVQIDQYPDQALKAADFFLKAIEAYKEGANILLDSDDENAIDLEEATADIANLGEKVLNEGLGLGEDFWK